MTSNGHQLQFDGVTNNLAAATAGHRDYLHHAEKALDYCRRTMPEFTAEDVRRRIPTNIPCHHHNVLPSLFSRASRDGRIRWVRSCHATRRSRHAGRNSIWTNGETTEPETGH